LTAGLLLYAFLARRPYLDGADFGYAWRAGHALLDGRNPYATTGLPFLYPLPAAMLAAPLTWLNVAGGSAVFVGMSTALLAYGMSAAGWWRLITLASPPFLLAFVAANWSPLIVGATTIPALGGLLVCKPNLGLMVFAGWPRLQVVGGGAAFLLLSLLIFPQWPWEWVASVRAETFPHHPVLRWELGVIGLLGLLRWRSPEGRLLAAFTLLPVSAVPYDFLVLWLVPQTRSEMITLTICAWLAAPVMIGIDPNANPVVRAVLVLGMVLPVVVMVWRRAPLR
jgi:hypothetical protein